MANFFFNIGLGRAVQLYDNIDSNNPANSAFIMAAFNTSATDTVLRRLDTLAAIEADANTAEVTNSGYARKTITDADLVAWAPDDVNDRVDLDMPDQVFTGVAAGTNWSDVGLFYDGDTTAGTDANLLPVCWWDFVVSPSGSDITVQVAAAGFARFTSA